MQSTVASPREFEQQHEDIRTHVGRIHALFHGRVEHTRARALLRQHLEALYALLVRHFAAEEDGGYMAEVLQRRPDLARRVQALQAEHPRILRSFAHTLAMIPHASLSALEDVVVELLGVLGDHDEAERRLVEDAVLQDLGVGD